MLRSDQSWALCEALEFPSQAELKLLSRTRSPVLAVSASVLVLLLGCLRARLSPESHPRWPHTFINVFIGFSYHYSSPDFLGGSLENSSAIRKISEQFIQRLIA